MIDDIQTHLFDLLAADPRLYQGGTAWAEGWNGVRRTDDEETAECGFVNLYESCYEQDSSDDRPAIYLGMKGFEAQDRRAFQTVAAPANLGDGMELTIPLVISVHANTKRLAKKQRSQLRQNVKAILASHPIEADHWYWLEVSVASGAPADKVWVSASGGGTQQVAEAVAVIPVVISYMWYANSPA